MKHKKAMVVVAVADVVAAGTANTTVAAVVAVVQNLRLASTTTVEVTEPAYKVGIVVQLDYTAHLAK